MQRGEDRGCLDRFSGQSFNTEVSVLVIVIYRRMLSDMSVCGDSLMVQNMGFAGEFNENLQLFLGWRRFAIKCDD